MGRQGLVVLAVLMVASAAAVQRSAAEEPAAVDTLADPVAFEVQAPGQPVELVSDAFMAPGGDPGVFPVGYSDVCGCAQCTIDYRTANTFFGERFLVSCSERIHRAKAHGARFWRRLTHQTYYPACPPLCDPTFGYRPTCWRRLPELHYCPPPDCPPVGVVVISPADVRRPEGRPESDGLPEADGQFLPPQPAMPSDPKSESAVPADDPAMAVTPGGN